jgi:phosphatidylserine decarboxylase
MSIMQSISDAIPPIHKEGRPFIVGAVIAALVLSLLWGPAFWLFAILTGWLVIFFRDPVRTVPVDPGIIVSPADGRIEPVVEVVPPPELGLGEVPLTRISVFMNVFDCHINRAPAAGTVQTIAYRPGKFLSADLDKASEDNERNGIVIATAAGERIGVVQIAGLVARRILCWTELGAPLEQGDRFGMIRFGSRLDVFVPDGSRVLVHPGQRAIAGETILASLPGVNLQPPFDSRKA